MGVETLPFELILPYGPGFTLVGSLDEVIPEKMTVETSWKVPIDLRLHLADHFPRPNKPIFPGVMELQLLAECAGHRGFRLAKVTSAVFTGKIGPGDNALITAYASWKRPEQELDPTYCIVDGKLTVNTRDICKAHLRLEVLDEPTTFLDVNPIRSVFTYTGTEVLVPHGPNLPNSILLEHMCQTCITINAAIEQFKGYQFWLTGIQKAEFFSDIPWGDTVRSRATVEMQDPKHGTALVSTFLDAAPVAQAELTLVVVRAKKAT